jgi:CcmD family protein
MIHLFLTYLIIWTLLFGYLLRMTIGVSRVNHEILHLQDRIKKLEDQQLPEKGAGE